MRPYRFTLTDITVAIVPFGILLGAALLAAETTVDLGFYRTVYTIWVATVLATPALGAFILPGDTDRQRVTWLLFWTLSFVVYLVHLGYAVLSVYDGNFREFLNGQGVFPAVINVIFTAWWALDVGLAWLYHGDASWVRVERVGAHAFIALTFVVSTVFLKHGVINFIGVAMTAVLIVCLMARIDAARPAASDPMTPNGHGALRSYPPFFGVRRELKCPPLERIDFPAEDGSALTLHHTSGGTRGPVVITPGTAMTALTYCIDTVPQNIVEFLVARGFDVWLFDWRTSPLVDAHERPYTLDAVARYDWPAAIAQVRRRTGRNQVSVLAHCLSSPCLMLGMIRGYVERDHVGAFVASQAGLHLRMTPVGALKLQTRLEKLMPSGEMMHQKPADTNGQLADLAVGILSHVLPKSYSCDNRVCYRHSATFGDLILHSNVNAPTHAIMGDLIPECLTAFLQDVAIWARKNNILTAEDRRHLDRLKLPIHLISGKENRMFVPAGTADTYELLRDANGAGYYRRTVYDGFGHLDCYIGAAAAKAIWPDIANSFEAPS